MTRTWYYTGAVALALATLAGGQVPEGVAGPELTKEQKRRVVEAAGKALVDGYVYEDKAKAMAERLTGNLKASRYDDLRDPAAFARRLTDDLQAAGGDRHLRVFGPAPPGAAKAPAKGPRRVRSDVNHGFARVEVFEGNVGYLDLRTFTAAADGPAKADAAMALLSGVDALVIDLGRNPGGTESMVRYLSAYLFDRPTHLVNTFERGMDKPGERWTADTVAGKRLAGVPVYLLVSRRTFSAAESFAFGLITTKRATVVGERTGGGGHYGGVVPLVDGFSLWLPRGRTYDPRTGQGWEAEGLKPDVEVPYERALTAALEAARVRIAK
jgi:hypothetical protein